MNHLTSTPWGPPQQQTLIAPGIISVSTARHGGIWLHDDRIATLPTCFARYTPYLDDRHWWEENCDAAIPMLAFPREWPARSIWHAMKALQACAGMTGGRKYQDTLDDLRASNHYHDTVAPIIETWHAENAQRYERGGMWTEGSAWEINFHRIGDGHRFTARFESLFDLPEMPAAYDDLIAASLTPITP